MTDNPVPTEHPKDGDGLPTTETITLTDGTIVTRRHEQYASNRGKSTQRTGLILETARPSHAAWQSMPPADKSPAAETEEELSDQLQGLSDWAEDLVAEYDAIPATANAEVLPEDRKYHRRRLGTVRARIEGIRGDRAKLIVSDGRIAGALMQLDSMLLAMLVVVEILQMAEDSLHAPTLDRGRRQLTQAKQGKQALTDDDEKEAARYYIERCQELEALGRRTGSKKVAGAEVRERFGVSPRTLRRYVKKWPT